MSLKEYDDLEKIRQEAGKKSRAHYKSLNLPGDRTKLDGDIAAAKKRIAEMAKFKKESES